MIKTVVLFSIVLCCVSCGGYPGNGHAGYQFPGLYPKAISSTEIELTINWRNSPTILKAEQITLYKRYENYGSVSNNTITYLGTVSSTIAISNNIRTYLIGDLEPNKQYTFTMYAKPGFNLNINLGAGGYASARTFPASTPTALIILNNPFY